MACAVTHLAGEQVHLEKSGKSIRKHVFMRHVFRIDTPSGGELTIFTKTGRKPPVEGLERYVSGLVLPEFRAPRYYGRVSSAEGETGIWHYASAEQLPLRDLSRENLLRLVQAVAAMNALTSEVRDRVPTVPTGTRVARPFADRLHAALAEEREPVALFPGWRDALDRITALEARTLARLAAIGNGFFSHQDITADNVQFTAAPSPLLIVDWESAAIAAPGASLCRLVALDVRAQADVAQLYVDSLQTKGLRVDARDALFVMGAVQVLGRLHDAANWFGVAPQRARRALRWSLRHGPTYLCR